MSTYQDDAASSKDGEEKKEKSETSKPRAMALKWSRQITASKKERQDYDKSARDIVKKYLDKGDAYEDLAAQSNINLFWSIVQVQKSTLYVRPPKIDVSRLYKDQNDDVSRVAGEILQRILNAGVEEDGSTLNDAIKQGIEDRLIVGMGQLWARYEADFGEATVEAVVNPTTGEELEPATTVEVVTDERTETDYVHWQDFFWSPARVWQEVWWVARRVRMDKDALVKRFGEQKASLIALHQPDVQSHKDSDDNGPVASADKVGEVFEIWDKRTRCVYWYAEGVDEILDHRPDPLKVKGFFPCPKPCFANTTSSRFIPRADYSMAQDIFQRINDASTRIKWLIKAAKVAGIYNQDAQAVATIFNEGVELKLIPVDAWAAFAEKGGVKGNIEWIPIDMIATVIASLRAEISAEKQELYEVLGISDIMRGASDPNETLGAQELKAQFGGSRIQFIQSEIAEWIAQAQRLRAEIISVHFQPETIKKLSNIEATPDAGLADQAIALIKDPDAWAWKISIDPDTLAALDWSKEREMRTQLLEAVGSFVQQIGPIVASAPESAPFFVEVFKWALAGFKAGKEIEGVLDQMAAKMAEPKPQGPSPEELKQQAETERQKMKLDSDERIEAMKAELQLVKDGFAQHLATIMQQFQILNAALQGDQNAIPAAAMTQPGAAAMDATAQQRQQMEAQASAAAKGQPGGPAEAPANPSGAPLPPPGVIPGMQ